MPTWPRTCSKMLSTSPRRLSSATTSRRISPPSSRRNLTRSTTPPGTLLSAVTSAHMWPTRPSTSSTSILVRSPSFSSSPAEQRSLSACSASMHLASLGKLNNLIKSCFTTKKILLKIYPSVMIFSARFSPFVLSSRLIRFTFSKLDFQWSIL